MSYLAYTNYTEWRRFKGRNRDSLDHPRQYRQRYKNQGYFWLVNLFVAGTSNWDSTDLLDLLQSVGWGLSANSLYTNSLWPGLACDVQGFFINMGDVSSSIWSLIIAFHTFLLLAGGQRARAWAAEKSTSGKGRWFFCLGVWASVFFLAIIGPLLVQRLHPEKGPFCTISSDHTYSRQRRRRRMVLDWSKLPPRTDFLPLSYIIERRI